MKLNILKGFLEIISNIAFLILVFKAVPRNRCSSTVLIGNTRKNILVIDAENEDLRKLLNESVLGVVIGH
jgi:hypothetical protein